MIRLEFLSVGRRLGDIDAPNLNQGPYATLEKVLAGYVREGRKVEVSIEASGHVGDAVRPEVITVRYRIDNGDIESHIFENKPGGKDAGRR